MTEIMMDLTGMGTTSSLARETASEYDCSRSRSPPMPIRGACLCRAPLTFEGPAADEFRLTIVAQRRSAYALAAELLGASDRALAAAAEVERQQLLGGA